MAVEDVLVRRGLVSAQAVEHAREVQKRGYAGNSILDLLVDLGHVGELELAQALADIAGVEFWDGQEAEAESLVPNRGIVEVRRSMRRLYYATANPLDEDLSNEVRFLSGSQEVIPLVATRTMIADAHAAKGDVGGELYTPPAVPPDEQSLRAHWQSTDDDEPHVRLANIYLLMSSTAPGRRLHIRAFDPPHIAVGRANAMHPIGSGGRNITLIALFRLAYMARAIPGPGVRMGRIHLKLPRRTVSFDVVAATTRRGESMVCERVTPYAGEGAALGSDLARVLHARWSADSAEREIEILKVALEYTQDPALWLDRIYVLEQLGIVLDRARRELEARPYLEQGLELIRERGLTARAEIGFLELLGYTEISDPQRRGSLLAHTREVMKQCESLFLPTVCEEVDAWLLAEQFDQAVSVARGLIETDRAMFGASSGMGVSAMAAAAHALVRKGDLDGAKAFIVELEQAWCAPDEWRLHFARGQVAAASEQHHEAVSHLRAALEHPHTNLVRVAAAFASALVAVGQINEAIGVARGVVDVPRGIFDQREHAVLDRIRHMSPYR